MSSYTGNLKNSVNYTVYVSSPDFTLPIFEYNVVVSNVAQNTNLYLPPVDRVPIGWTILIKNNNPLYSTTLVASGTDQIINGPVVSSTFILNMLDFIHIISCQTSNGRVWNLF